MTKPDTKPLRERIEDAKWIAAWGARDPLKEGNRLASFSPEHAQTILDALTDAQAELARLTQSLNQCMATLKYCQEQPLSDEDLEREYGEANDSLEACSNILIGCGDEKAAEWLDEVKQFVTRLHSALSAARGEIERLIKENWQLSRDLKIECGKGDPGERKLGWQYVKGNYSGSQTD